MNDAHEVDQERVLVLAPTAAEAAHNRSILAEAGLACEICADLGGLQREIEAGAGAVLLSEEALTAGKRDDLIALLRKQPPWSDIPIRMLCDAGADSPTARWAMEHLGNVMVLERPVRAPTLRSAMRTAIRVRHRQYRLRDQMQALLDSEQRFIRFMEHLPGLAWLKDCQGRYVYVNEAAANAFRAERAELYGKTDDEVFPPETAAQFRANDRTALAHESGIQVIETLQHADGLHVSIVNKFPIPGNDGSPPLVGGVAFDITEQKRAEEALRRSEQQLRLVIDALPAVVTYIDRHTRFRFINRTLCEWFGLEPGRILGRTAAEVMGEEAFEQIRPKMEQAFAGEPVHFEAELPYRHGGTRAVEVRYVPDVQADGTVAGYIALIHDVSERKNAERLRLLHTAIVESSDDAIIGQSVDGTILTWNPAARRIFGYAAEEVVGRPITIIIPPERHDEEAAILERLARGEHIENFETVRVAKDGRRIDAWLTVSPLRNAAGEVVGASKIVRDVTESKRAQAALRKSEERFGTLAANAPAAVFVKDRDGRYTLANPLACEALGKPDGAVGFTDHELLPADVADELRRIDQQVVATGDAVQKEEVVRRPGYERRFLSVKFPLFDAAGQPDGVCGVAIDITDRKRAEDSLRDSEERFRTLADNIAQFAWTADRLGWTTWYNQRWYDYTGSSRDEARDRGWEQFVHPDHLQRVNRSLAGCLHNGTTWEETFPLRGRDGRYRWFLSRAVPIRDESGRIVRWFGTNTDVTAQREAEERLRESDRRKDEFLAMLAHELRNPLAPIRSGLDVLCLELGEKHEIIQIMQEQIEHVVRLVDDLLDVSRIVRGRIELRMEPVELSAVIYRAVSAVESTINSRRHELRISIPQEDVWLRADPVRLVQIIENLLNNAAKYTDEGGMIELRAECRGPELCLSVRDTGVGIDPDLMPRIFDLFAQSSRSLDRSQGGLGIGLTLVRNLVELHGGSISAASKGPGTGSEFTVRLPLAEPPATAGKSPRETAATAGPRKILIVDDNAAAARMLALLLSKQDGHQIETVHDGPTALDRMRSFQPDVVLLDIGLPGMNGYEVAGRIREDREFDDVLLAALTGYGQLEDVRKSEAAGFDEHLVKPPALDALQRLLVHPKLQRMSAAAPAPDAEKVRKSAAQPTQAPPRDAAAGRPADDANHAQLRSAVHELGNLAHAVRIAAYLLKTTEDPANVQTVQEILEETAASMGTLGQSLRDIDAAVDAADTVIDEPALRSPSGRCP